MTLFLEDPTNPKLRNHKLLGEKKEYWSFWVTREIRVVYVIQGGAVLLYDTGSHDQVY